MRKKHSSARYIIGALHYIGLLRAAVIGTIAATRCIDFAAAKATAMTPHLLSFVRCGRRVCRGGGGTCAADNAVVVIVQMWHNAGRDAPAHHLSIKCE